MTAVITGLDHYHFHTGGARPSEGVLHESFANTAPLVTGVNHKHIDLTHRVLWVQSRADPPDWAVPFECEINVVRFGVENRCEIGALTIAPAPWVERCVHEGGNFTGQGGEDRFPCSQGQVE